VPAVEPDVQGATTIREQLDRHRSLAVCAGCHAKIDPPGFALESFDVIGGQRDRYRSIGEGLDAPRGKIDPFIGIQFKLGPKVDPSGALPDGRKFKEISEFQVLLAAEPQRLLKNLAEQLCIYSTGRPIGFGDRAEIAALVDRTQKKGGGVRTLIHELVQSKLFLPSGPPDKSKPLPTGPAKPTLTRAKPTLPNSALSAKLTNPARPSSCLCRTPSHRRPMRIRRLGGSKPIVSSACRMPTGLTTCAMLWNRRPKFSCRCRRGASGDHTRLRLGAIESDGAAESKVFA